MPNFPTRLTLFLSSYAPLFLILALRSWADDYRISIGLVIVAVISVIVLWLFVRQAQSLAPDKIVVSTVISRDGDAMSYIVTYLLPFLAVNFKEIRDVASLSLVFVVIGLLYVNSNMIYTNPMLNIAGYHIFEVEYGGGKKAALICKRPYVQAGSELNVISLGDYVLMEKH